MSYQSFNKIVPDGKFYEMSEFMKKSRRWAYNNVTHPGDEMRFWILDLIDEPYYTTTLFNRVCELTGQNWKIRKVYVNGQTHGQCGSMHQDCIEPGDHTFLMYMNPEWKIEWGGMTVFETGDVVVPKPNTAIFFKADIWHAGLEPTALYKGMRMSLTYKLAAV